MFQLQAYKKSSLKGVLVEVKVRSYIVCQPYSGTDSLWFEYSFATRGILDGYMDFDSPISDPAEPSQSK